MDTMVQTPLRSQSVSGQFDSPTMPVLIVPSMALRYPIGLDFPPLGSRPWTFGGVDGAGSS